jgi:hypothetical protein
MASTYSPDLRLELIGSGEQSGVWGSTTNLNLGSLVEQAVAGVETIAISSSNQALTAFFGAVDQSRNAVLVLSSGAAANVYVPPVSKVYVVKNTGSFAITMFNSTVLGNTTAAGTGLTVAAGTAVCMFTDGTNFSAAGIPIGASTGTGNVVFAASPTLTGVPLAPTANAGTSTTQIATTAFVNSAVTTATSSLGTMSTQNAANVAITGGTITGITDLTVADGGTGVSTLAANNVLLGNGTSSIQTVAPGTSGNVLTSNGTTWTSTASAVPSIITQQAYSVGTTHSISVGGTRPIALTLSFSSNQGLADTISADFQWGLGSLANTYTFYTSTSVNFQVSPSGTITVYLIPSGTTTLQFRANTTGSGFQFTNFFVSAIQF